MSTHGGEFNAVTRTSPSAPNLARQFFMLCPKVLVRYEIHHDQIESSDLF